MNRGSIVHGRLLDELGADVYPSWCTILFNPGTAQTSSGKPVRGATALEEIPCSVGTSRGREIRRPGDNVTISTHRIALQGHFPQVTPKMQAVVDEVTYDILAVDHDSQSRSTYLEAERVR